MNVNRNLLDANSMHIRMTLLTSLILRYWAILHLCYQPGRSILNVPGMKLWTSMDLSVNTTICATTHGHHSPVHPVSNWCLGPFRLKYLSHKSTNTSRVASVTSRQTTTALCILLRTISGSWTRTVHICNGSRDRLKILREHYHSSIATS